MRMINPSTGLATNVSDPTTPMQQVWAIFNQNDVNIIMIFFKKYYSRKNLINLSRRLCRSLFILKVLGQHSSKNPSKSVAISSSQIFRLEASLLQEICQSEISDRSKCRESFISGNRCEICVFIRRVDHRPPQTILYEMEENNQVCLTKNVKPTATSTKGGGGEY